MTKKTLRDNMNTAFEVIFTKNGKKISLTLMLVDVLVITLMIMLKNSHNVNVERKTNESAYNSLVMSDSALDEYKNAEIKQYIEDYVASKPVIVYDGLTQEQLTEKLNNVLHSTMSGKGELVSTYALEKGVDPYVATAIILLETGCNSTCSSMVNRCYNVGGQKGSGCGSYAAFSSLDDGIRAFVDNLYKNYYSRGYDTVEKIGPKYAESNTWIPKVNNYIMKIKNS